MNDYNDGSNACTSIRCAQSDKKVATLSLKLELEDQNLSTMMKQKKMQRKSYNLAIYLIG